MKVIKNDMIVHCDVDDTLVLWYDNHTQPGPGKVEFVDPYDGQLHFLRPHTRHIKLLQDFKARGYHITVWSGAGWQWAEVVVKTLGLEDCVDIVMTKNVKFMDDLTAVEVLGSRIYLNEK